MSSEVTLSQIEKIKSLRVPLCLESSLMGEYRYCLCEVWSPWFNSFGEAIANLCSLDPTS
jgi:hypothetical protein